ncbi:MULTISPECIES: helix-turn-helix transcriptional regulator [Arthrobacter]|uniref:Helix-turn-helix transcriptional regulator n=2 Tax=Arthrobacter TaxID=1663 RepID=A0ABU9KPK5_9MICC|nr:helix-turn-helix transcriptional regulator [Arthrobacter sp. YJM1]MDP5228445.1 helix-turn-helix transcriptional regulator [Arthrobacter sp. YJM1]
MNDPEAWRKELGNFLAARRRQAVRGDYGLPQAGRGKDVGLRREEVAFLSAISVTWYTWLEQGRKVNPSREVLTSLATVLRLDPAEQRYLLTPFGYAAPAPGPGTAETTAHVQRLLDAIGPNPALALEGNWDIVAWNRAYSDLFPRVLEVTGPERNLLKLVFTDPAVRALLPDWEQTSAQFLAEFRAETGSRIQDARKASLVAELMQSSPDFRAQWEAYGIRGFTPRTRAFNHPDGRTVTYEHHQLSLADAPALKLIVYTPASGADNPADDDGGLGSR